MTEVPGKLLHTDWSTDRPDVVQMVVAVRATDLASCSTPLPEDVTVVVPDPELHLPMNGNVFTLEVTREMLHSFHPELRKILLNSRIDGKDVEE